MALPRRWPRALPTRALLVISRTLIAISLSPFPLSLILELEISGGCAVSVWASTRSSSRSSFALRVYIYARYGVSGGSRVVRSFFMMSMSLSRDYCGRAHAGIN